MRFALKVVLALLVVGSTALAARAPRKVVRRFAIHQLRVDGNVSELDRKILEKEVRNAVEFVIAGSNGDYLAHEEDVVPVLALSPELKTCFDAACTVRLGDLLKVQRMLSIVITRSGAMPKGEWIVKVSQFAVDSVRSLGTAELPCHNCTRDELVGDFNRFLDPLFKGEPEALPLCSLKVSSRPPGANVVLDATTVGVTPFEHSITAGKHVVAVEKTGFARGEADLECPASTVQNTVFALTEGLTQLVRQEPIREPVHHSPALKIVGGALLVLGAAGVIAGAIDLARDGKGTCDLTNGHTQCPSTYDTGPTGAALVGVGAVGVVGGIVALAIDAVRGRPARVSADLRVGPGGAFVGARGTF